MRPPTPETTSIITIESGSTRICMPTWKEPPESHVYAVESSLRSPCAWLHMEKKETSAPAKATKTDEVPRYAAVRREIDVPASVIRTAPASGASKQSQPPTAMVVIRGAP